MSTDLNLIATTAFGLEAIVKRELAGLGYDGRVVSPGWVRFRADRAAICRTNLWLRTADRVLIEMAKFEAKDFDTLYETTRALPWTEWIGAEAAFPVIGRSIKSQLSSVPACQRAVKKAIVESLFAGHNVAHLPESGPVYRAEVALLKDQVTLTIDTTGASLHKRGYRVGAHGAPLKETLAAAMVLLSFWKPERPLIDPFCGNGTIPIEAAMIGRNRAPGLQRAFQAETWPNLDAQLWAAARDEARDLLRPKFAEPIVGTDIDARALQHARDNAQIAGVCDQIHFQQRPFEQLTSRRTYGCVITNPPYGQRMGSVDELDPLYRSIPFVLRNLPTWSHFVLTAYPDFETLLGKQANRRRKLYNGRIECTYYQFHGPDPKHACQTVAIESRADADVSAADRDSSSTESRHDNPTDAPVFGGLTDKAREQAELFRRRLTKRAHHLRRWPTKQGITCFRLYDRDIPEIPLVVDRYEDHLHICEYERPHDRDVAQHADWLDLLVRTASETLDVLPSHVFLKRRVPQRGPTQHNRLADHRYELTVQEGGLKFLVNLSDYVDTGLFLDHRITRSMVHKAAAGADVLNLFGYTGTFTAYAAVGGARSTTTVDWSRTYLDWARRNLALNGFNHPCHEFVRADAREFLASLRPGPRFDLAIVDPPTFSNSKRTDQDWSIQDGYIELLNQLLAHMKAGGMVFFSTNFRRFKFDASVLQATQVREISQQTVPPDFRNRRIHRCWRIER